MKAWFRPGDELLVSCGRDLERGGQCGGVLELVSVNEDRKWRWQNAPLERTGPIGAALSKTEGYDLILECLKCGDLSEGVLPAQDLWEESARGFHA